MAEVAGGDFLKRSKLVEKHDQRREIGKVFAADIEIRRPRRNGECGKDRVFGRGFVKRCDGTPGASRKRDESRA